MRFDLVSSLFQLASTARLEGDMEAAGVIQKAAYAIVDMTEDVGYAQQIKTGTHVPMPASIEQAKLMHLISENYLKHNGGLEIG